MKTYTAIYNHGLGWAQGARWAYIKATDLDQARLIAKNIGVRNGIFSCRVFDKKMMFLKQSTWQRYMVS